ncbi:MAG: hypothetical protein K0Q72_2961 [Armatimonadetes bacterium]|nr:hypothetical protein [Armatimonadota bacterium]
MWTPISGRGSPPRKWGPGWTRSLSAAALAAMLAGGSSGCTAGRTVQAADAVEAPIVTIRTLAPARKQAPAKSGRLAMTAPPQANVDEVKAEKPAPRPRRRRARRKPPVERRTEPEQVAAAAKPAEPAEPAPRPEPAPVEPRSRPEPPHKEAAPVDEPAPVPAPEPEPTPTPDGDGM